MKKTILVVDNNEINREILVDFFENDYNVIAAENGKTALEHLNYYKTQISLVILDLYMPVMDGYELLEEIHKNPSLKRIPVMVATSFNDSDNEKAALEKGAVDFVAKPYDLPIIKRRAQNLISVSDGRMLRIKSEFDPLTKLYNRETFCKKAHELLMANPDVDYDILCFDIDRFKIVNDLFGTAEGDNLLVYIADMLRRETIPDVTVSGRLSGDIFATCLPHIDGYEEAMARNINNNLEQYPLNIKIIAKSGFCRIDNHEMPVSILCDWANMAIKSIKGSYSERFAIYNEHMRNSMLWEQEIINDMNDALREGQFIVYYQPKVNMLEQRVIGSEALVRWIHPEKGMISPAEFIPIFEKNGFISALDFYIWEIVCRDLRSWIDEGYSPCPVSVNVSRAELYDDGLCDRIERLINRYSIDYHLLQLEITESAYTENPEQLITMVQRMKEKGFVILMDDFGSGYSSLNTLKDVPVDVLKIDLKFLYNIDNNVKGNQILKSVVQMAKRLNLIVIAEGVETEQQVEFLKSIGCLRAQGYYYAKPVPKETLPMVLEGSYFYEGKDEDQLDNLVNVDDVMTHFHTAGELDWYRAAILQLNAVISEYDRLTDTLLLFERPDSQSNELVRNEINNFKASFVEGKYIHPQDCEEYLRLLSSNENNRTVLRTKMLSGNGGYIWAELTSRAVNDDSGNPRYVIFVCRDVTKEKNNELIMKAFTVLEEEPDINESMKQLIPQIAECYSLESLGLVVARETDKVVCKSFDWDIGGNVNLNSYVGYVSKRDELTERKRFNEYGMAVFYNDVKLADNDEIAKSLFGGRTNSVAVGLLNLAHGYRGAVVYGNYDKRVWSRSELNSISEITKCLTAFIDKSYSAEMLRESLSLYQTAFSHSKLRLWLYDLQSERLYRNTPSDSNWSEDYVDNFPESFIETGVVHAQSVEKFRELHKQLKEGKEASGIFCIMHADKHYHWIKLSYTLLKDSSGNPIKAMGVCDDTEMTM